MNKINPIYIIALMFVLFIISYSLVNSKKEQYKTVSIQLNSLKEDAKKYKEYKTTWFDKNEVEKRLNLLLKNNLFKKEKILKSISSNQIKVKIESDNQRVLNKFLNRVLNEKFILNKIDIQKRSIYLEIGLK